MTSERLIRDYFEGIGQVTHPEYKIANLQSAGCMVMFEEKSQCENYSEFHQIEVIDIVAWAYGEMRAAT